MAENEPKRDAAPDDSAEGAKKPEADAQGGAPVELDELSVGPEAGDATADAAARGEASAGGAEAVDPRDARIAELEGELQATKDQLMRAVADVQNAHKRAERERKDAEAYGGIRLARDLLVVYDNIEAALKSASDELQEREPEFFNGLTLTQRNLIQAFEKHNIQKIEPAVGQKFDPNVHQAMFEQPTADLAPGSVADVMQVGFSIADRLLRPALVGVAKKLDAAASE